MSVVAPNKALAVQTSKATAEISAQIAHVQAATGQAAAVLSAIDGAMRSIDDAAAEVAAAVDNQQHAIADIAQNTQRTSTSAASVSTSLQILHETFDQVGEASGDIRTKIASFGESAQALRAKTEDFLRDALAA